MAQLAGRLPKWGCEFERRSQNGHPLGLLEVTSPMPFENPFGVCGWAKRQVTAYIRHRLHPQHNQQHFHLHNSLNQLIQIRNMSTEPTPSIAVPETKPTNPKAKKPKAENLAEQINALEISPRPSYFEHRLEIWERLKAKQDEEFQSKAREKISVTLPGVAKPILWDLERPLESSCSLRLLDFESDEGKRVFWHSSAHVLGEAAEKHYGCHLCIGPPTDEGFFYEMGMGLSGDRAIQSTDYASLQKLAEMAIKEKQPFERLVVSKTDLLEMFAYNKYKQYLINSKIPDGTSTTVYRCGPMIDLCVGPHIPNTGQIKAFSILKNSASYFLGDSANDSLQRIYGISFPDKKAMVEYKKFLEEAAKRDHRKIGKDQDLFFFHELSPGSCFWLPHGTRIYNTLVEFFKSEYRKRGYDEVISPNMYNSKLWQTSGHWENYADSMFKLDIEKETFGLKPMNCPGHCLIFGSRDRSYRELPIRMADFGVLHRNEASGALSGLTRVRRFCQDDAHHFCTTDQIDSEMAGIFDLLKTVYGMLGFTYKLKLSTRPDNYIGDLEVWNQAEKRLGRALDEFVGPGEWDVDPGDGAFYGPKADALKRRHQCATIQLDFQLPERFKLQYRTDQGGQGAEAGAEERKRPVMIHRAIMGSVERFTAILTEHFAGKWPFWLSPRQVLIIPVAAPHKAYAQEVAQKLWDAGLYADADMSDATLPKKIRNGEVSSYNFILVVGSEELESRSVNVRSADDVGQKGKAEALPLEVTLEKLLALKNERRIENRLL
ncbi:threonine--tRNA ligase [Puccinia sorghi]|uniref:Probable threonine--tRNA ligase, cytoplasmic n=1 Tax=Puccinia sorghi TaxID=27349 RepID=A0A0L6VCX9_9BASI|nr:threonine--tRNA ligase [Puccinia sorghi]